MTTNYDDHLATAARDDGLGELETWCAPAVPLGHNFSGLVHLHGSITRPPDEMVLTDRDFGRAYLTQAWAPRFLLPMFDRYTVLFIGYGHDDPVMRYLALGLPSHDANGRPRRFAFTSEPADPKWQYLGITPIGYSARGRDHRDLNAALDAWSLRATMGQTEHEARAREIVGSGTTIQPVERDYLLGRLRVIDGVRDFVKAVSDQEPASKIAWLQWLDDFPDFRSNFSGGAASEAGLLLGDWFCDEFVRSPELNGAALQTVQRLGQVWNRALVRSASWAVRNLAKDDPTAAGRWKALLASSIYGHSALGDLESLLPYEPSADAEELPLLRAAMRPSLALKRRWTLTGEPSPFDPPNAEVVWGSDEHELTANLAKILEERPNGEPTLGAALEDALDAAYDLQTAYHGDRHWDALSFGRSAIEPHAQDDFRDPIDAIVDALRDYGEKALSSNAGLPERWWSFDKPLFRRLAVHLVACDDKRDGDAKVEWLLARETLYETDLKHEAYGVLAQSVGAASAEVRRRLVETALRGPELPDDIADRERHIAYSKYNLLVWLVTARPEWPEAVKALAEIQEAYPHFEARDHPDLDRWKSGGTWGGVPPMELETFARLFRDDPYGALTELIGREYSERNFGEPTWHDALRLVTDFVSRDPGSGEVLWDLVESAPSLSGRSEHVFRATIDGWAVADVAGLGRSLVERVASQTRFPESARSVSRFLLAQVKRRVDSDETVALAAMRDTARQLWREQGPAFDSQYVDDPVSTAPLWLNSWPGDLAQYWISEIDRRWRKHRGDWSGLNSEERDALEALFAGSRSVLDAVEPAAAAHLFFLFAADEVFARARILPLFSDDASARLAWTSYLYHPRYDDRLLAAGFLECVLREFNRLGDLREDDLRAQFLGLVVAVVSYAGIAEKDRNSLLTATVTSGGGAHAIAFAEAVVRFVSDESVDGEQLWSHWLRRHLGARLDGRPREAEGTELAHWADVVPWMGSQIPAAAALFGNRGIGLAARFHAPDVDAAVLAEHGATLVAFFSERLRNSRSLDHLSMYEMREFIEELTGALGETVVQPLVDAANEVGILGR
ncbi:MAG: SIR2 family protein [Demequina sp.]|nr:SIR2 family protein [Demequina sp.]